jgi:hypothetical protein
VLSLTQAGFGLLSISTRLSFDRFGAFIFAVFAGGILDNEIHGLLFIISNIARLQEFSVNEFIRLGRVESTPLPLVHTWGEVR